ncbi:MAG: cyclase family protein [Ruminococcaceae bacterium]|nr:cyclase family protein [Oscillospiraceae bacterium]
MNFIDISTNLLTAEVFPGDPEPRLQRVNRMEFDDEYNLTALYASLHTGTHVDAPSHVYDEEDALTVTDIPLSKFIGPVQVITLPTGPITGEIIEDFFPRDAKKVIIRTSASSEFLGGAAEDLANLGYDLIGYDKLSLGGSSEVAAHRSLLGAGTVLLEGLDLSKVPHDGEYFLIAQPIKIEGMEASFVRAVLIDDYIFWSAKKDNPII